MASDFDFRFSSEVFDTETGLVYYNFRYYSAEFGRWLSRDPIGEEGGLNLSGMANNNVIDEWDSLGMKLYKFKIIISRVKDGAKEEFEKWDVVDQGEHRTAMGVRYIEAPACICEYYEKFIPWKKISPKFKLPWMVGYRMMFVSVPNGDSKLDKLAEMGVGEIPIAGEWINAIANMIKPKGQTRIWFGPDNVKETVYRYYRGYKFVTGKAFERIYFREKVSSPSDCPVGEFIDDTDPPYNDTDLTRPGLPNPPSWENLTP
jgi:RHS repeat-associated protein